MLGVHCTEWYMFTLISKKYVYINPMTFCIPVYGCRHDLFRQMSAVKYDLCFTFQLSVFFIVRYSSETFPSNIYIPPTLPINQNQTHKYSHTWLNSKLMCLKLLDKLLDILRDKQKFYIFITK